MPDTLTTATADRLSADTECRDADLFRGCGALRLQRNGPRAHSACHTRMSLRHSCLPTRVAATRLTRCLYETCAGHGLTVRITPLHRLSTHAEEMASLSFCPSVTAQCARANGTSETPCWLLSPRLPAAAAHPSHCRCYGTALTQPRRLPCPAGSLTGQVQHGMFLRLSLVASRER